MSAVLQLSRLEDEKASILLRAIKCCAEPEFVKAYGGIYQAFFTKLVEEAGRDADSIKGVLYLRKKLGVASVTFFEEEDWSDSDIGCLESLMTLLQRPGWLQNWFSPFLNLFTADYPTPLRVIETLIEPAAHFEYDIEDTQRLLRDFPELVQPEAVQAQEAEVR